LTGRRCQEKNSEGWFRLDLRTGWVTQADVMFIKPKPAAAAQNK